VMQPLELLTRLAALVPPPRHPLIRFHGALAPHSSWRATVVPADAGPEKPKSCSSDRTEPRARKPQLQPNRNAALPLPPEPALELSSRIPWAELPKRSHAGDALACPCGGRLHFIALILDAEVAEAILQALGLPSRPPPVARARAPDLCDD
jgi:hypothetical protein